MEKDREGQIKGRKGKAEGAGDGKPGTVDEDMLGLLRGRE